MLCGMQELVLIIFFTWLLLEINVGMVFGLRNAMSTTFSQQIICDKLLQGCY